MSLFLPLSTDQYHAKPMAISSITSPVGTDSSTAMQYGFPSTVCPSPSSSSTHSESATPPPASSKSVSLSPHNHSFSNYSTSSTSSFQSSSSDSQNDSSDIAISAESPSPYYHPYRYASSSEDCASAGNISSQTSAPISLHERRQRNKAASAKYRAKKNQQQGEMRAMISSLTKENELLIRQLNHIQHENSHLKSTCDKLRGKLMAQKMLKQYLVESEQQIKHTSGRSVPNNHPSSVEDSNYFPHDVGHQKCPEREQGKTFV